MKILKQISQIFMNDNNKVTARYVWGGFGYILCGIAFILDGIDWYNINPHLFDSLLTASTVAIGFGVIPKFAKNNVKNDKDI